MIHGGSLPRAHLRLQFLIAQWQEGVRFTHLYFLTGERRLDPVLEQEYFFLQTECEMPRYLWEQAGAPEEMRSQVEVHFIVVPMKDNFRPTMDDTVLHWLRLSPPSGRYLAISNAPYTPRQDAIVRALAPVVYEFDTAGPSQAEQTSVALLLDELARHIFQLCR